MEDEGFYSWLKSNVKEFKDYSIDQIKEGVRKMEQTEEGRKASASLKKSYEEYKKSKPSTKSKLADGGKMQYFICKHSRGGNVNCGCDGMVVRAEPGTQLPERRIRRASSRNMEDAPDIGYVTRRRVGYADVDGNRTVYEEADVDGTSAQTWVTSDGRSSYKVAQRIPIQGGWRDVEYNPGTREYKAITGRLADYFNRPERTTKPRVAPIIGLFPGSTKSGEINNALADGGIIFEQEGGPVLTRRQARELSGLNRGYSRSNFQTAMANADLALRNTGLRGKELRQAKRRMVAGINVEPTPEVALTDNTVPTVVTQPIQEAVALSELPVRTPVIEKPVRPVVRRKPIIKVEQPVVVETAPVDDGEWIFGTHPEYAPRPGRVQIPERRSWFVSALGDARDAKIGAIGAGQVRDLYAEGRDEEAKELAKNYTIANAVGIAGAAGTQAAVEGLPYIKAAAEKAAAIKRIPSIEEADVLRRAWNNGAGYVPISGFKCGGQVENAQRGGRISHALNWLVSGLQDARDSRIGAVGAGPVRELYNEGRDTEASNYAQNYALANLGGALGAVGANSAIGYTAASNMVNPGSVLLGEEMASGAAPGVMIGVSGPIMDEVDNKKKNKK